MEQELAEFVRALKAVPGVINLNKEVVSSSGLQLNYYFDVRVAIAVPSLRRQLAYFICRNFPRGVSAVAATGYGGVPLATEISSLLNVPLCSVRPEPKAHGLGKRIEGYAPKEGDVVAVVDDVVTTGGSLETVIEVVESVRAWICGCYVVVKRDEFKADTVRGYPLHYLLTPKDLL